MNWMKNTSGKPDAMLSLGVITLAVVLFKFLTSEMILGPVTFGQLDGGVVAALLTPTLGAYVMRRYTDSKTNQKDSSDDQKS